MLQAFTGGDWVNLLEVNHHEMVYDLVAKQLRLDADLCKTKGLRLMISAKAPR